MFCQFVCTLLFALHQIADHWRHPSRLLLCHIMLSKTVFFSSHYTCFCPETRPKVQMHQETSYVCSHSISRRNSQTFQGSPVSVWAKPTCMVLVVSEAFFTTHVRAVFILVPVLTGYSTHTALTSRETLISWSVGVSRLCRFCCMKNAAHSRKNKITINLFIFCYIGFKKKQCKVMEWITQPLLKVTSSDRHRKYLLITCFCVQSETGPKKLLSSYKVTN